VAYATAEELAAALRISVTAANQAALDACLAAAAVEIDYALDVAGTGPIDADPLANRVNVLRGVEWWKANDAAFGSPAGAGGSLAEPAGSFARHSATLLPLKSTFGVA
jgi:hypothetical protein